MPEPPALTHNYDYRRLPHYQKADRAIFVTFCRSARDPFPANARDAPVGYSHSRTLLPKMKLNSSRHPCTRSGLFAPSHAKMRLALSTSLARISKRISLAVLESFSCDKWNSIIESQFESTLISCSRSRVFHLAVT